MRKIRAIIFTIFCGVLLMGSMGLRSPVLPSKNFYVNDYAGIIDEKYREAMLATSTELFEKTGAQIVVLTVQGLGGISIEDYAQSVFSGWDIGGETRNGALILASIENGGAVIFAGDGLADVLTAEKTGRISKDKIEPQFKAADYLTGIYGGFEDVVKEVSGYYGEELSVAAPGKKYKFDGLSYGIIVVGGLLIVLRGWRVSGRYRRRYNKPYVYKRRTYTRKPRGDDDDYPSGFGGAITVVERGDDAEDGESGDAGPEQ